MKRLMILVSLFLFVNTVQAKDTEKPKGKQSPNIYEVIDSIPVTVEEDFLEIAKKEATKKQKDKATDKD